MNKFSNSDIFDRFVKIAEKEGIFSADAKETKKKLEETGRADSLDISAIEALYGTKAKAPQGMEYKNNIMEIAHPNSIVVSPSYDKLNGLVENEIERQNITLHIIQQTPNGLLTQKKYAQKELMLSLVRIANDLDNKNKNELRSLADHCLAQTSKLQKTAGIPALPIIAAVGLLIGLYAKNHLRFVQDGFEKDHQKLIGEIDDLLNSNQSTQTMLGAGQSYTTSFLSMLATFKNKLENYHNLYISKVAPAINDIEMPSDATQLLQQSSQSDIGSIISEFTQQTNLLLPLIKNIELNFSDENYKLRQIEEKGKLTSIVDAIPGLHGGAGFVADDFDDVKHALQTYVLDIENISKVLNSGKDMGISAMQKIKNLSNNKSELPADKSVEDIDQKVGDLEGSLLKMKNMMPEFK